MWFPDDWKTVITEKYVDDDNTKDIKYRKYISVNNEVISVNYTTVHSFHDDGEVITYKDDMMNISSAYLSYTDCSRTYGDNDEYEQHIRTYILIDKNGKESTFIVRARKKGMRNLTAAILKTNSGFIASQIF